jgi:hypothetical protein
MSCACRASAPRTEGRGKRAYTTLFPGEGRGPGAEGLSEGWKLVLTRQADLSGSCRRALPNPACAGPGPRPFDCLQGRRSGHASPGNETAAPPPTVDFGVNPFRGAASLAGFGPSGVPSETVGALDLPGLNLQPRRGRDLYRPGRAMPSTDLPEVFGCEPLPFGLFRCAKAHVVTARRLGRRVN